jgi:hypothetical protein
MGIRPTTTDEKGQAMEGFEVVTSDDCKLGRVVDVRENYLIVEHGTLRKTRHAVPTTFAHADEAAKEVRLSVSKEIVDGSPKIDNGSVNWQIVAEHYGLAEATPAPETEGYGEMLPDDPGRSADEEAILAGRQPADQQRAEARERGTAAGDDELGSSPALLGDRIKGSR